MKRVIQKQFGLNTFAKAAVVRRSFTRRRKAGLYIAGALLVAASLGAQSRAQVCARLEPANLSIGEMIWQLRY